MYKKRKVSNSSENSFEEIQEHKTLDYLEYENDKYQKAIKQARSKHDLKEKEEIGNLESWFKRNVKLKKQIQNQNLKSIVNNYFDNNKNIHKKKEKSHQRGVQEINIQLIQDITHRKITRQQSAEAKSMFRSTIQNFKTLKSMFDKQNMRNFEPTKEQTANYHKENMNTDYLNYLNDFNKQQLKKHISAVKDQFLQQINQIDDNILKVKEILEKNIEKTLNFQNQIKQNQQKIQYTNQQAYTLERQLKSTKSELENDKNENQVKQMLSEKLFILEQYKNLIQDCKANLISNNQVITENQQKIKVLKMEKLNIQLILKDIILQDYHNQSKNKESFYTIITAIWKIDQEINDSIFPIILDEKSQIYLVNIAKLSVILQQCIQKKKNLQKFLETETRKKIKDTSTHIDKYKLIQQELKKIKNVTTSRDIKQDKIQLNKQEVTVKGFNHQQYDDYYYQNKDQDIQQILKQKIEKQSVEIKKLEEEISNLKNEEKLRLYNLFNHTSKLCEKTKREILIYVFGYKEVDQILQSFYQMKQQGI